MSCHERLFVRSVSFGFILQGKARPDLEVTILVTNSYASTVFNGPR